ncbi:cAMP phosphodiesterase regA [Acrasis kona]|uniref:Phosphodiesterase n=1 Tax=Acrasis kona TaxID=1008807 RepID=A0AAW2ZBN2_9EUKA
MSSVDDVSIDNNNIPKPEGNIRVLVVDDDSVTRSVVSKNLRALGYEPVAAAGGSEALELLNKEEFLLMLVDVMMPEMDGFSLIRFYRQAFQREIPSIMMSGSEEPETVAKSFQCGAEDFLPKPIRPEILKARIQRCLAYRDNKSKEKSLLDQIDEESEKTRALKEQVAANEKQLQEYKRKVNDTIETPLQIIISTVSDLLNGKYQAGESKLALITIMKSLSGSDLYRPAFVDYMKRTDMDDATREWLMNQYSRDAGDDPNAHKNIFENTPEENLSVADGSKPRQGRRPSSSVPFSTVSPASPSNTVELPFDLDTYVPIMVGDQDLASIRYNAFDYSVDELKKHIMYMYKSMNFISTYNINPIKLWNLLGVLKKKYVGNYYHNFRHCIDVTQYAYMLVNDSKLGSMLSLADKFMQLTAALVHDVGHPGVNNNYLIATQDDLALVYNDRSVLENHHATIAFRLLSKDKYNILQGLNEDQYREFRKVVVQVVLATDMANHFAISSKFESKIALGSINKDIPEDKLLLMKVIMKCADINNQTRPFDIAKRWSHMCIREFLSQGDKERSNDIPVSPLMDRNNMNFPKSQMDFINYIVEPLYKHLISAFGSLNFIIQSVNHNRAQWKQLFDEQEKRLSAQIQPN